jgi:hypothetical protein
VCPPPPPWFGGKGTLAGERGGGKVPILTIYVGLTLWYSIYMYFVVYTIAEGRGHTANRSVVSNFVGRGGGVTVNLLHAVRQRGYRGT